MWQRVQIDQYVLLLLFILLIKEMNIIRVSWVALKGKIIVWSWAKLQLIEWPSLASHFPPLDRQPKLVATMDDNPDGPGDYDFMFKSM